jgi:hypothetical protein
MLWRVSRPLQSRSKPPGLILPRQPALAERPPSGPGWVHEIKFDGYRVIARKDGERVRLWARTTSDYSKAFTRIRNAVAALPVDSAVLDGKAIVLRSDNTSDFEALRSRQGQAEAILVAYDIMETDGQDVRAEPLEERRKRLSKLLRAKNKALRDGIQLSEAITGDGATIFRHACWMGLEGIVSKRIGPGYVSGRTRAWLKTKNPDFRRSIGSLPNSEGILSPKGATRGQRSCLRLCEPIATGRYRIRLLSQFGRTDALLFQESGLTFHLIRSLRRETDCFLPRSLRNVFQFVVDIRLIYPLGSFIKTISSEHGFDHQRVMTTSG